MFHVKHSRDRFYRSMGYRPLDSRSLIAYRASATGDAAILLRSRGRQDCLLDHKGVALPDVTEARKFATTFARELMEIKPDLLDESAFAWSVQVSDGRFRKGSQQHTVLASGRTGAGDVAGRAVTPPRTK